MSHHTLGSVLSLAAFAATALTSSAVSASEREVETFALIIGTNTPLDADLAPLKYADDDAARYYDLFKTLGAKTYLLSRLDEGTERLHVDAARVAHLPRRSELEAVVKLLRGNISVARARGRETVLYFIYAGHGSVENNRGYITLEDDRLYGNDLLERVVAPLEADNVHMIIDACNSYFLAYERGAGGSRRPASGFSKLKSLSDGGRIGLILSTSSAAESHEWDAFQAGVFSHEVRSGLYGAADANHDGTISYRELAAFVATANAAIPNEKYRPKLHARPPTHDGGLVDLSGSTDRFLEIDGALSARYLIETDTGVRLADFHNAPGEPVTMVRPQRDVLFVRRVDDNLEYQVHPVEGRIALADIPAHPPAVVGRGAAHQAFSLVFSVPFGDEAVARFSFETPEEDSEFVMPWGTVFGVGGLVGGAALVFAAAGLGGAAAWQWVSFTSETGRLSGEDIFMRNLAFVGTQVAAVGAVSAAALSVAAGGTILLWPGDEE